MASQGVLDKNMFTLHLPSNGYETGELLFGATNSSLYKGSLSTHPLYPTNTTLWEIEAKSVPLVGKDGTLLGNTSLAGYSALFDVAFPFMLFHNDIVNELLNVLHPNLDCWTPTFPCERVKDLPDIVFNLDGHEYVFTGGLCQEEHRAHVSAQRGSMFPGFQGWGNEKTGGNLVGKVLLGVCS